MLLKLTEVKFSLIVFLLMAIVEGGVSEKVSARYGRKIPNDSHCRQILTKVRSNGFG